MLLSLEMFITEVLGIGESGAIPNQRKRRVGEVRSGSVNMAKTDEGCMGTRESLLPPHERWSIKDRPYPNMSYPVR